MEKILKVNRFFQGKKHTNKINISGDWLKKYGFDENDLVKVEIRKNEIVIKKNENTGILTAMNSKNPELYKLIEKLELTA